MDQRFIPPPLPTQPQHSRVNYDPPGRPKRSMLAWWAVFPFLGFIIVQAVFGWQTAVARATAPEFAISYLGGSIVGGLLVSLVIAYVAYHIGSKSQFAASLTFTIVLALFCGTVYLQANPRLRFWARTSTSDVPMTPKTHEFPAFKFEIAGGWRDVPPSSEQTAAMLVLDGESATQPRAMIMVDMGKTTLGLRETAARLAGPDGRILPDPVRVDAVEGLRVETSSTDTSRPKLAVLLLRGQRMYLIMAAASNGYDVASDFEQVLTSWKWREDGPPSR
ncbi:MAG: hypothetical protein JWN40_1276 [Phycisphaerales bacterium]|nr:hypothetical protein [Phycisphaerales bacterium]